VLAYYLDQAFLQYGLFELSGQYKRLRKGRKFKQSLQCLHVDAGCPNATPLLTFLVAHETSLVKKNLKESVLSAGAYQRGLDCMVQIRHVQFEGILNEREGRF
jgi:hypothetical protein